MADKIAAVATGHARTGIGILRLSGDGCIEAAGTVFRPRSGQTLAALPDRKLALGTLYDVQGRELDHCMAFISRAPHSYTGEDTAEIQCHGSPAALAAGLKSASKFLMVAALAAIGLNTNFKELCRSGAKPMLHGFIISLLVVLVAIAVEFAIGIAPHGVL